MEEQFSLPVTYRGQEHQIDFTFRRLGYTYKISAEIQGQTVLFEPDEEGSFRATQADPFGDLQVGESPKRELDRAFIQRITEVLTIALK